MKKLFLLCVLSILSIVSCGTPNVPSTFLSVPTLDLPFELLSLHDPLVQSELLELGQLVQNRTSKDIYEISQWHSSPIVKWNEISREWVAYYFHNPVVASRVYAIVSVSQQRALDEIKKIDLSLQSRLPQNLNEKIVSVDIGCEPFECAVLIGVAEQTLLYLFPNSAESILNQVEEARQSLLVSGNIFPSDLDVGEAFGRSIAQEVIAERTNDGSATAGKSDPLLAGEGIWKPDPFQVSPQAPGWSKVTPWLLASADQFRSDSPPQYNSIEFNAALDEVYEIQQSVTHEQLAIADYWADEPGT
ncbi:MAG: hypothetical protein HC797_02910, partial [Anaerolineales bacterium]|nr:hypothetical protein [Anaerolineales bacterium]